MLRRALAEDAGGSEQVGVAHDRTSRVAVPAGAYTYGRNDEARTLGHAYQIMKHPVTNAQFAAFLNATVRPDDFNRAHVAERLSGLPVVLIELFTRRQGLVVAAGNPLGIGAVEDLRGRTVAPRQPGSGSHRLLGHRVCHPV